MSRIIAFTGKISAGKSSAASILCKELGYKERAFATTLKRACMEIFGFNEEQVFQYKETPDEYWGFSPRTALQKVGDALRSVRADIFLKPVERDLLNSPNERFVISDLRYPNEAEMVRRLGGKIVRIRRPGAEITDRESIKYVLDCDAEIINDGSLEDLREKILKLEEGARAN